jgi:succinyl-diaminopimelate desuccinylase
MTSETIELLRALIKEESITPDDKGCQEIIKQRLSKIGFAVTSIPSGKVSNLWAIRGKKPPILAFVGHTDVVPVGDLEDWETPPFTLTEENGYLYGRGVSDMKSSVAAMITAVERFVVKHPHHEDSIAFIITSDEEGIATDGTVKIVEYLKQNNITINACLVGEPSSNLQVGDTIKHGRRGSISGKLILKGIQGHVAYPYHAENPIHRLGPVINELNDVIWDEGNEDFPPTSFQISNIKGGTGVDNVIPGSVELVFNFRYSTAITVAQLKNRMVSILNKHNFRYEIIWGVPDLPFLTKTGTFLNSCVKAIKQVMGFEPNLSTDGGTSDGRFIAPMGAHVVEIGPCNATIHAINEHIKIADLEKLTQIYEAILEITLLRVEDSHVSDKLKT